MRERLDIARLAGATIVMLGVVIGLTGAALAAETADDLEAAARALKARQGAIEAGREQSATLGDQAKNYRGELGGLRRDAIAVVARTQSLERALDGLEARLAALGIEEAERRAALIAARSRHGATLGAMLRLSRRPPRALLLAPDSAVDATRSALLLAAVSRGLDAEAGAIQGVLAEIDEVRNAIARDGARLKETQAALARERAVLDGMLVRKAALERATEAERLAAEARLAVLVSEAKDLEELVAKLEAERIAMASAPRPPPARPTEPASSAQQPDRAVEAPREPAVDAAVALAALESEAMRAAATPKEGSFAQPVEGAIVTSFGAPTAPGVSARGITFEVRPAAPVVAPFAGKVVFAGPFRQYGLLLIIAHGEAYHSLLAGLDRIDVGHGRWVLAGEPIGAMGTYSDTRPQLYLELRHKGRPVNPVPWLAIGPNQSSG